jgi:hypothetical protein
MAERRRGRKGKKAGGAPPRRTDDSETPALSFSPVNGILGVAGLASITAGYVLLAQGSITAAPLLLVLGYVVLLPLAIIL